MTFWNWDPTIWHNMESVIFFFLLPKSLHPTQGHGRRHQHDGGRGERLHPAGLLQPAELQVFGQPGEPPHQGGAPQ